MLNLSLLKLPRRAGPWRYLRPYELHQALWTGFPGLESSSSDERFLYRHEELDDHHSVLVQSTEVPDWTEIERRSADTVVKVREFDPQAIAGDKPLRFLLRANPTTSRTYPDELVTGSDGVERPKSRRIAVGSDRKQLAERMGVSVDELPSREEMLVDWLRKKGESSGYSIVEDSSGRTLCDVSPNRDLILRKGKKAGSRSSTRNRASNGTEPRITITTVDYTGVLRIDDPDRFAETIRSGIGRARAFGCGLLSLAPV